MPTDWTTRDVPEELAKRYRDEGYWIDESLGSLIDRCLTAASPLEFRIWSKTRPYRSTLGDVHQLSRRLAGGLAKVGVKPGDVVAFQLPNWMEAAAVFWGAAALGAVLVPVVHFYGPKELGFILRQSGAKVLVTADRFGHLDYMSGIEGLWPDLPALETVAVVGEGSRPSRTQGFAELVDTDPLGAPVAVDPSSPALVAYTSGTTAEPKGVIHTHLTLGAELRQSTEMAGNESRPSLMGAPVGHAIGMLGGLLYPVQRGRAVHLTDVWDPSAVLAAMDEAGLVFSGGATYFLTSLLDCPDFREDHLALVRQAGLGGSPVPPAVGERASRLGISVMRSYGSTEHPSITGAAYDEPEVKRISTDGHPLGGVDLRLADELGRPVAPGEAGAIFSRGPELFAGYTDEALTRRAVDRAGWYDTGDIGILDADGWLTITDRVQDVIIRGGENISAGEVEGLLLQMPAVAEAAVVAAPDERLGEHACAFVRLHAGVSAPELAEVREHLERAGLARQKWPEELRVVDDLPRTPSSKVKKYVLRDQLRKEAAARGRAGVRA